jgi:hypothetical protein
VLQIVQGKYFRDVPLTDTVHRAVLYTNLRAFGEREARDLPFGRILPSTTFDGVASLTIEAHERLETLTLSGQREVLAATSGGQLIDEIAALIAFSFNVVCVRDYDMARRLIAQRQGEAHAGSGPASILRQTFDATVVLSDESLDDLVVLVRALVELERKYYEAAMRAIRQVVDAILIVDEDATLAYTLMVAALESLGQTVAPPRSAWSEYDRSKRARIEAATVGLSEKRTKRIQDAVLANEHLHLQRRFVAFVLGHVEPDFYRNEAVGAIRPMPATALPAALRHAYALRSRNIHALESIAPEIWMAAHRSDTASVEGNSLLSLEGLARVSRHVIRRFIARAPRGVDPGFNYRSALPGIIRMPLAPQHWIQFPQGFNQNTAPAVLDGMISYLIEGISGRSETGLVDMTAVIAKIEQSVLGLSDHQARLPMAGIVALWQNFAAPEKRAKLKQKLIGRLSDDLRQPSIVAFALSLLLGQKRDWSTDQTLDLSAARRRERLSGARQPMPERIDAALHLVAADQSFARGEGSAGLTQLSHAVETVPGLVELIEYEEAIMREEDPLLDLYAFVLSQPFLNVKSPETLEPQPE